MVVMVKAKTPAPRKPMSTGHKAALARGRAESASVRHYLEALETSKPKRGRKRTPASIDKRLGSIEDQLVNADALTKLHLLQEQKDLTDERLRVAKVKDLTALEKQFIKVAQAYGERKGISYGTWRAAGVSAHVLQAAGISRARRRTPRAGLTRGAQARLVKNGTSPLGTAQPGWPTSTHFTSALRCGHSTGLQLPTYASEGNRSTVFSAGWRAQMMAQAAAGAAAA